MDLTNILAVSGKPDLNELVSRTKNGAIVKNLVTGQKFPVFASSSISQLSEIRMFTTNDEKPLEEIFENIYKLLEAKPTEFDPKKAESEVLFDLLAKVLPDYDKERVHASDAKKLFSWYNVLLAADKLTPTEEEKTETEAAESLPPKSLRRSRLHLRRPPCRNRRPPRQPHRPRPLLSAPPQPRRQSNESRIESLILKSRGEYFKTTILSISYFRQPSNHLLIFNPLDNEKNTYYSLCDCHHGRCCFV